MDHGWLCARAWSARNRKSDFLTGTAAVFDVHQKQEIRQMLLLSHSFRIHDVFHACEDHEAQNTFLCLAYRRFDVQSDSYPKTFAYSTASLNAPTKNHQPNS
jgi:hypothetical protein